MQGIGSFIANCRIGSKIAIGFAAVLLILAVSSTLAWLAFGQVTSTVDGYAELVATSAIYRDIDLTVAQYRGHVREYVASDNEDTADLAVKEGTALHEHIATGLVRVTNPERHGLLENMAKQAESYTANFARVRDMNREQAKLETEVLDVVGPQTTDGFSAVLAGTSKAGNTDLVPLIVEGRRLSLLARLDVNKRLGRHDEAAAKSAEQQFDELKRAVAQLDTATRGSELNAAVAAEAKLIDSYQSASRHAMSLDTDQTTLVNGVMRQAGDALAADAVKAKDSNFAAQGETEQGMQSVISRGNTLVMILGLAGLAVGVALAWVIGRGISRPVVRMCVAMRALAGGDKSVEIPGVGRKDEIGQMADTVQVFKDSMVEADRLRDENERHKAEAEAARKSGMIRLADTFEAGIKGVVNSVASQAPEAGVSGGHPRAKYA
jgi:HAMP domain-containing protein/CHASE3 domain sensor protein